VEELLGKRNLLFAAVDVLSSALTINAFTII
jgi:hypothetical protein